MAKRFTRLPCGMKIRITDDSTLEFRGDYGAPEADRERAKDLKARSGDLSIDTRSSNLRAIAKFFAKEAKRVEKEDGCKWTTTK